MNTTQHNSLCLIPQSFHQPFPLLPTPPFFHLGQICLKLPLCNALRTIQIDSNHHAETVRNCTWQGGSTVSLECLGVPGSPKHIPDCATALCGASLWIPRVGSWLKRTCPPCLEPLASSLLEHASRCCVTQVRLTVSDKWLNMQWKKPAELCVHTVWKFVCPPSLSATSLWYQTKDTDCWYFIAIFYS